MSGPSGADLTDEYDEEEGVFDEEDEEDLVDEEEDLVDEEEEAYPEELAVDEEVDDVDDFDDDYEPGDVNRVADSGYVAGDVNAIEAAAPAEPEAAARGGMPIEVLTYLAQSLADEPDSVVVRREDRRGSMVLRLHVAARDMGRVIGRRGRTAQAIRTLVGVAGARDGVQTVVDIADD